MEQLTAAFIGATIAIVGSLILHWFDRKHEKQTRFLQAKLDAYSAYTAQCSQLVLHQLPGTFKDFANELLVSQHRVLLLAPKRLVEQAQDLTTLSLEAGDPSTRNQANRNNWAQAQARFIDALRTDLSR